MRCGMWTDLPNLYRIITIPVVDVDTVGQGRVDIDGITVDLHVNALVAAYINLHDALLYQPR